jgi:2-C-methyl-D-erythritol 4-phosphate cytidylyltransferase
LSPANPGRRAVVAVVLAGGAGKRFGADRPKQLLPLGGRTVLEVAVAAFRASPEVDEVLVVLAPHLVGEWRQRFAANGMTDVFVIEGGVLRTDSTRAAILALGDRDCDVLFHDAARPLVDGRIIADCVRALETAEAVSAAVPCADTVGEVDAAGDLKAIPDRDGLRNIQTPQGFRLSTIRDAYRLMEADQSGALAATDDCGVLLRYLPQVRVTLVEGSASNLKVTQPSDLGLAEQLLADRSAPESETPSSAADSSP